MEKSKERNFTRLDRLLMLALSAGLLTLICTTGCPQWVISASLIILAIWLAGLLNSA